VSRLGSPPPGKPACFHSDCEFHECRYTSGASTDAMLARGVRVHLVTYTKALQDALSQGVPTRTLVEWGIPWHDIQRCQQATAKPEPCAWCDGYEDAHAATCPSLEGGGPRG
jgi:hypothetical protein